MLRSPSLGAALTILGLSASAWATTTEPNGTQVPRDSMNGEIQLYTLFTSRNDAVDWQADAHTTPDVFSPLCNFQATFVLHQAGSNRGVGWYNVDPNRTTPPALADIHVIVPAGTTVGTVITSASIKNDPAYAGGLIGFALVDGQIHYSEQKWNVVCTSCSPPGPWILAVVYKSVATPNAYYLAFEDGSVSATSFNNDGDFNDDVFLFEGLTCQGGGTPCSTGLQGACADGLNVCSSTGLTCQGLVQPTAETCDGIDNDCNGQTDDGNLCAAGFVCDHGKCVARCAAGEFACDGELVCSTDGFCVEPLCATVTCTAGTVCRAGVCKAPCDGITCPVPTTCRAGVCVDPCAGVTCNVGSVCDRGVCVPNCDCNPCAAGLACDTASEKCVDPACVGQTCAAPEQCIAGACADPCATAVCPTGQECKTGVCVPLPKPDGGAADGGSDAGSIFLGTGGIVGAAGATGTSGGSGTGATSGTGYARAGSKDAPGCSCRLKAEPRSSDVPSPLAALVTAGLLAGRRRRNRAPRPSR